MAECVCPQLKVGGELTGGRNWNPDCPIHGLNSDWWISPEQTEKRRLQNERLRDLQEQAREARRKARDDR